MFVYYLQLINYQCDIVCSHFLQVLTCSWSIKYYYNNYKYIPYSTYYKPMMYYKPTPLFSSKFLYRYRTLILW